MAEFATKQGMNIRLAGKPAATVEDASAAAEVAVFPPEFHGIKPRLLVKEGDKVKRGTPLLMDKGNEAFKVCAPAAGTVKEIKIGARRSVQQITIAAAKKGDAEDFGAIELNKCKTISRDKVVNLLLSSGYLAYLIQRPFSRMADPTVTPKSIFVNAMDTAPFRADVATALAGNEQAFQAGLFLLGRLTDGIVHLVVPGDRKDLPAALTDADQAELHRFTGPHPAGNTSVHIHKIDPISPGDNIWTIHATDLIQIGRLALEGTLPGDRVISLGGPGVRANARKHYKVRVGGALSNLLDNRLEEGETRVISGDVMGGESLTDKDHLPFYCRGLTVIAEDKSRHLLGWLAPGLNRFSHSPLFMSTWLRGNDEWALGSNTNGGHRSMVLTGHYDKYLPMNIMVDYLVRAVIANDTDEAITLGILETDPEDFSLCSFVCPSKMDLGGIIRRGLDMIEAEGI